VIGGPRDSVSATRDVDAICIEEQAAWGNAEVVAVFSDPGRHEFGMRDFKPKSELLALIGPHLRVFRPALRPYGRTCAMSRFRHMKRLLKASAANVRVAFFCSPR
jgi:hypothetical protein